MERIIITKNPSSSAIILVAPHGHDDLFTDLIAEETAQLASCSCVINKGFKRGKQVDYDNEIADLNRVDHILSEDVIKDEFLEPIVEIANDCLADHGWCQVLTIHGMSDKVPANINGVIGFGAGNPPSLSAEEEYINAFFYCLNKHNFPFCAGVAGGTYSAFSKNNLNQLWRKWSKYRCADVMSLQVELIKACRDDEAESKNTAALLGDIVRDYEKLVGLFGAIDQEVLNNGFDPATWPTAMKSAPEL